MNKIVNLIDFKENNHEQPLVSILCITFNHVDFIRKTLNGFLIQEISFPVEIIIHDDASQDGTQDIIREYEALYPNIIKPIYQEENQYSKKVDFGKEFIFPKIKGKYIATCEGDDYWTDPFKLQKQVDFLEQNTDYGLVYTDIDRVDQNGDVIDKRFFSNSKTPSCKSFEDYLINAPFSAPCTWLFRKSLHKEVNKNYVVGDLPILLDIVAYSKIYRLEETTAHYRVLKNSASHFTNLLKYYSFIKGVFEIQIDYAHKYNVSEDIIDKIQTKFAWTSYNFAVAENDKEQIKIANKLLIGHPELTYKFKIIKLLSKLKTGRLLVRRRLIKQLGLT